MNIIKRNGQEQEFNSEKITKALEKCFHQIGKKDAKNLADKYLRLILNKINRLYIRPSVETIQDTVEIVLLDNNELAAYEQYSKYRKDREIIRTFKDKVPEEVKKCFRRIKTIFS